MHLKKKMAKKEIILEQCEECNLWNCLRNSEKAFVKSPPWLKRVAVCKPGKQEHKKGEINLTGLTIRISRLTLFYYLIMYIKQKKDQHLMLLI